MGVKIRSGGVWVSPGVPTGTGTVPGAPTGVTAVSGSSGNATITWTAPSSVGSSPITGYAIQLVRTSTGQTLTASASSTARAASVTGLVPGATYTVSVQAVNAVGASLPSNSVTVTVSGSTVLYGPDGNEWAPNTVADGVTFDVVVNSLAALQSAIAAVTTAQANAGYRIGLADGEYSPTSQVMIGQNANLHAAAKAILVRAVNPGQAHFTHGVLVNCSNVALAYCSLGGSFGFHLAAPMQGSTFLRCYGPGSTTFILNSTDNQRCGLVGVVIPDRFSTSGDRLHVDASGTSKPATDFFITRCWVEGIDDDGTGGHTDTAQWTAGLGTHRMTNTYFGAAGDNGTSQVKPDQQGSFTPFMTYFADTCWYGGASIAKATQGNSNNQGGPDIRNNCVFHSPTSSNGPFKINVNVGVPAPVVTNSVFYGSIPNGLDASSTGNTTLPTDYTFTIPPLFVKPPWAWW